ncbi:MAG: UDP-N-acetylglucosamine 2-epimerase (non-hydrolyzing) [Anaerolineae bacterium]|nr:UDP-N-acetylglucosamine 2-epimerase (non-hydrolyzing) [Anaerolineae bacterium]
MAPIIQTLRQRNIAQVFVHTGQHYDEKMSTIFFEQLNMPRPDVYLAVGSGTHAQQTAKIMTAFEEVCLTHHPQLVVVAGDVNSTLACALTAAKLNIPVAHVESGLRSFDRAMPEEINRILTDHIADLLFTTEESGDQHLNEEGIARDKVHFVGNTMIDSLVTHLNNAVALEPWGKFKVAPHEYGLVTFHRPSNVDETDNVKVLVEALGKISQRQPLIFPIHPRTISKHPELWSALTNVQLVEPLGYLEFLGLMAKAAVVVTDSGGIQEETTALGVRCVTVRNNTERPVTISLGTNQLVELQADKIFEAAFAPAQHQPVIPPLWDGKAAARVVDVIEQWLANG